MPQDGRGYDAPLDNPWPVLSASARPWRQGGLTPTEANEADIARIVDDFVAATQRADRAGFEMIEIQAGHGFLLSSFITPIMNQRSDAYGGSLDARMIVPLKVLRAVRAAWPSHKPVAVRISATDWSGSAGIEPGTPSSSRACSATRAPI